MKRIVSIPALLFLFFSAGIFLPARINAMGKPGIEVKVHESGTITIGRDTVGSDELARYIQTRLFKSYLGTGQMPVGIFVTKENENVPAPVMEVVVKEVQEGQRRALTELCLEKYKRLYENIDKKKKSRLQKQFPVLFQSIG